MNTTRQGETGLTLIEAIVSTAVVVILTGFVLVAGFSGRRATAVRTGAQAVGGFLREAASLTLNGARDQSCIDGLGGSPTEAEERTCSQYTVTVQNGAPTYTREPVGGGDTTTRSLPAGAYFNVGRSVTFKLDPPRLTVHLDGAGNEQRTLDALPIEIPIVHADAGTTWWRACVSSVGSVTVVSGTCPL